jgi:hypothetical protein
MQTAFSITDVSFSANRVAPNTVNLTVNFKVNGNGPSHVTGLILTTDFWITSHVVPAKFQSFAPGSENWKASFQTQGSSVSFEFVIFCDDFGGVNSVPRIWNTNNGNRFRAQS